MHSDIRTLLPIDRLDRALQNERRAFERAQRIHDGFAESLKQAKTTLNDAKTHQSEQRKKQTEAEHSVRQYQNRRSAAVRALETGVGDAAAAERQITNVDALIDALETDVLECMEEQEQLKPRIEVLTAQHTEQALQFKQSLALFKQQKDRYLGERAELNAQRRDELSALPSEIKYSYEGLIRKKGRALMEVKDGICVSCNLSVSPALLSDARRGVHALICVSCGRFLITD